MDTTPHEPNKLSKWLELLQQESWQLELIISGFAIVLVAGTYDALIDFSIHLKIISQGIENSAPINIPMMVLMGTWAFLLLNLVFHVILRGLWISTIGLRYVSGGIELDKLSFAPRFDHFLRRNMVSYDEYIERLEKLCSVVFAFTFLIIFMFISFGLFFFFIYLVSTFFREIVTPILPKFGVIANLSSFLFLLLTGLFYLLDFVTLGYLKKKKWIAKVYYPLYRFYSWITLSFLYRPLYYNLIDNKFGRRLGFLLVPYVVIVLTISSLQTDSHPYFPSKAGIQKFQPDYYADQRAKAEVIKTLSLPSKFVKNGFLEIFIPYIARNYDPVLKEICPDLKPFRTSGLRTDIIIISNDSHDQVSLDTALFCFEKLYEVYLNDSLYQNLNWQFSTHQPNGEKGLITLIDVKHLNRGRHELLVKKQFYTSKKQENRLKWKELAKLVFWIE